MQRNGNLPEAVTAVLDLPAIQVQGTDSLVGGTDSLVGGTDSPVGGTDSLVGGTDSLVRGTDNLVGGTDNPVGGTDSPAHPNRQNPKIYRGDDALERRLLAVRLTMETLLGDPTLIDVLAPYGYDSICILAGQALYRQALALVKQHSLSIGDQLTAADAYVLAEEQVHACYKRQVAFARLGLRDDRGAARKLDLSKRKSSRAGWLLQADQFYTNALANQAILIKLAGYSVTVDQLLEAQQQVAAVASSIVAQQRYKQVAKESKQARDAALKALNRWILDFMAVARIALADQPQRLEQLGLSGA